MIPALQLVSRTLLLCLLAALCFPVPGLAKVKLSVGIRGPLETFQQLARQFEAENPDVQIAEVDPIVWNLQKVITRAAAGVPYDVVYVVIEEARALVAQGLVQPLDPLVKRDWNEMKAYYDDVHPALLKAFNVDGAQYLLPFEWNNMMVYYNTRLFSEAGLSEPAEKWRQADFVQVAAKLTRDTNGDKAKDIYGYKIGWTGTFFVSPWIYNAGGTVLDDAWRRSTMNGPEVVEALDFLQALVWEHGVAPPLGEGGQYDELKGNLAMWSAGRWPLVGYLKQDFKEFDVNFYPAWRQQRTVLGGGAHGISSATKNPEAAWKFLKFVNRRDAVDKVTRLGDSLPSRRSVALGDAVLGFPPAHGSRYYRTLDNIRWTESPPEYPELGKVFDQHVGRAVRREISARAAAEQIHAQYQAILSHK